MQLYIYLVRTSWNATESYEACFRQKPLNPHGCAWHIHICAVHRRGNEVQKCLLTEDLTEKEWWCFSQVISAQWQLASTGLYCLLLNMELCEALQCFGEVWWLWCENGLKGILVFYSWAVSGNRIHREIVYSTATAEVSHLGWRWEAFNGYFSLQTNFVLNWRLLEELRRNEKEGSRKPVRGP